METNVEIADKRNYTELSVVGDSHLVQSTNVYGFHHSGRNEMPEEATASNVAILNRVVNFGFILYRY